jgi:hypothetical protein
MRSIRKLALMGLAALMVLAVAASAASATTIRTGSATGPTYSGAVAGTNNGNAVLATSSGFGTVTCTSSSLGGSVTSGGSATISSASWTGCTNNLGQSCTASPLNLNWTGSIVFNSLTTTPNGTMTVSGSPYAGAQVVCGSTTCNYGASSVSVGINNPNGTTGSQAIANGVALTKQSGSGFACSASATWTAKYDLKENGVADLYVTA